MLQSLTGTRAAWGFSAPLMAVSVECVRRNVEHFISIWRLVRSAETGRNEEDRTKKCVVFPPK